MSDGIQIRVSGLEEAIKNLATLPTRVERKVVSQSMRAALKPLVPLLRAAIPIGVGRTGGKYPHAAGTLRKRVLLRVGKKFNRDEIRLRLYLGTLGVSYYGRFFEYGHGIGKRPAGIGHKRGDVARARAAGIDKRNLVSGRFVVKKLFDTHKEEIAIATSNNLVAGIEREVEAGRKG